MAHFQQKTGPPPPYYYPDAQPQLNAAPQPQQYPVAQPQFNVASQPQILQVELLRLGPHSTKVKCPSCRNQVNTSVTFDHYWLTHVFAASVCVLGGFLGCCFIPYCVNSLKRPNHYCPNCRAFIGSYMG